MAGQPLQELRRQIARSTWLAMVNDEAPDDETLQREGYFDAADAVLSSDVVPRSVADSLADALERELDAGEREAAIAALKAYRAVYPREETP